MAIKQRTMKKLEETKNRLHRAMIAGSKAALGGVCRDLTEIRDLYREGLSRQNYDAYGEICDGLILAVRKLMEDGEAEVQGDALALCKELLEHLAKETERETHFKKEIVFLPYKGAMWDSLESVWKAATEDKEHCNAYVIPIPYADRKPDGSAAEWHCEREEYPKYVPTLDWQSVDLKEMHPDVIFIHNPYDNQNFVTSVEPRYYSGKLKECTDQLVYIPYFVLEEIDPENEEVVKSIQHFVMAPGVMNADLVIVQSEKMREAYIQVLTKYTNVQDRSFWEKRILGIGSPKFDKVLLTKKEDLDIPEKWRRIIEKPDGTWKKIVFYNTGLSALLQHNEKMLQKMRRVFAVFKEYKGEIALLWRPHPLILATIKSMRPKLLLEYEDMLREYRSEGWGIYDDTADVDRAVVMSDAYYGDGSSVVRLYEQTGKPIMMQVVKEDDEET